MARETWPDNYHGVMAIGKGGVHLVHRHGVHAGHLVLLLPLHPSVLEPDLYLPLRQAERVCYLDPDQVDFTLLDLFQIFRIFRIFLSRLVDYLRLRVRYLLKWNSFSSSSVW